MGLFPILTVIGKRKMDNTLRGITPIRYVSVHGSQTHAMEDEIVEEELACLSVNGSELASFMCSPNGLEQLALGFLYNEGIIHSKDEIATMHISRRNCVEVWLNSEYKPPQRLIVTAGCGGGVTFDDLSQQHPALDSNLFTTPGQLAGLMRQMQLGAVLYRRSGGIHTAALADGHSLQLQVEDVGRHNCLDKLAGAALQSGISTRGKILLTSGRVSSEMINKARRLETPIVCSRTSPTSLSTSLANAWNITLVAYVIQDRMRVYTHPERLLGLTGY